MRSVDSEVRGAQSQRREMKSEWVLLVATGM